MNYSKKRNFQFTEICLTNMAHLRFNAALYRLSSFPWLLFHTTVSWSVLSVFFTVLFPSWHHRHQTPSLHPFISDVAISQMQLGQSGVLLQGQGQRLEAGGSFPHTRTTSISHTTNPSHAHMLFHCAPLGAKAQQILCLNIDVDSLNLMDCT